MPLPVPARRHPAAYLDRPRGVRKPLVKIANASGEPLVRIPCSPPHSRACGCQALVGYRGQIRASSPCRPIRKRLRGLVALLLLSLCGTLLLAGWGGSSMALTASSAGSTSSAGLVKIDGARKLFLTCRGTGAPTVVLISGFRGGYDDWTHVVSRPGATPRASPSSVFPQVAGFTRVCAYDRPGTTNFDGSIGPSTPVRQPTTAQDDVGDLHALLGAAGAVGPYVLVAHSWGGMIAYLYASEHPGEVAGMVLVDPGSEFLKTSLRASQWHRFVRGARKLGKPRILEAAEYERSVDAIRGAPAVPRIPAVVLTSDRPFDFGAGGPQTWSAWLSAQNRLAAVLDAKHIAHTHSGHYIAGERPRLVINEVRDVVRSLQVPTP